MTITLETLRADFDAWTAEKTAIYANPESTRSQKLGILMKGYWPANLYRLANEFGVPAAILFKLSDGAIDPRKAGVM